VSILVRTYVGEYGIHNEWFKGDEFIVSELVPESVEEQHNKLLEGGGAMKDQCDYCKQESWKEMCDCCAEAEEAGVLEAYLAGTVECPACVRERAAL